VNKPRVLIADTEESTRFALSTALESLHVGIDAAMSGEQLLRCVEQRKYVLIVMDLLKPGEGGLGALEYLQESRPEIPAIIITAHGTIDLAASAMKLGAIEFLQKPLPAEEFQTLVARILKHGKLRQSEGDCYASLFERAKCCLIRHHKAAVVEHLRRAIAISPERPEAFNLLGAMHELRGEMYEALNDYRVALALDAAYEPSRFNLERATGPDRRRQPINFGEIRKARDESTLPGGTNQVVGEPTAPTKSR
jgi:FixJ family two-component response regulator